MVSFPKNHGLGRRGFLFSIRWDLFRFWMRIVFWGGFLQGTTGIILSSLNNTCWWRTSFFFVFCDSFGWGDTNIVQFIIFFISSYAAIFSIDTQYNWICNVILVIIDAIFIYIYICIHHICLLSASMPIKAPLHAPSRDSFHPFRTSFAAEKKNRHENVTTCSRSSSELLSWGQWSFLLPQSLTSWLVNLPPRTTYPPRNSRPYDQGLLTIGFP